MDARALVHTVLIGETSTRFRRRVTGTAVASHQPGTCRCPARSRRGSGRLGIATFFRQHDGDDPLVTGWIGRGIRGARIDMPIKILDLRT